MDYEWSNDNKKITNMTALNKSIPYQFPIPFAVYGSLVNKSFHSIWKQYEKKPFTGLPCRYRTVAIG